MLLIIKPGFLHLQERILSLLGVTLKESNFKMLVLRKAEAENFYHEHASKAFYQELIEYMTSGLVLLVKVPGNEEEIVEMRRRIGNTDPAIAEEGTVRRIFGKDKTCNAIHCSDSIASGKREEEFFNSLREV